MFFNKKRSKKDDIDYLIELEKKQVVADEELLRRINLNSAVIEKQSQEIEDLNSKLDELFEFISKR